MQCIKNDSSFGKKRESISELEQFRSNSNAEIKDLGAEAAAGVPTGPVNYCSSLILRNSNIHTATSVSNLHPCILWRAQFCLCHVSTVSFNTKSQASLTCFWGHYSTWWLVLCSAPTHYQLSVRIFIFGSFLCVSPACKHTKTAYELWGNLSAINLTRLTDT